MKRSLSLCPGDQRCSRRWLSHWAESCGEDDVAQNLQGKCRMSEKKSLLLYATGIWEWGAGSLSQPNPAYTE